MRFAEREYPLTIVVGSGGVGKTTLAASIAADSAARGERTLVMTFDPSLRLKDALGMDDAPGGGIVPVELPQGADGRLDASLLDPKATFDGLVRRYSADAEARDRILNNPVYDRLAGQLAGILEYMAVERLFEVAETGEYDQIVLDTPPTRQALDFLEAPDRILAFLDSGALKIATRDWFDADGKLQGAGPFNKQIAGLLDRLVGLGLLRDMVEFFQAFQPLYAGFRERALAVQELLRRDDTLFLLVAGPGEATIPDTMFFARKLEEAGHRLGPVVVNRLHPEVELEPPTEPSARELWELTGWLGRRDARGLKQLRHLLQAHPVPAIEVQPEAPTDLSALMQLGARLRAAVK